MKALVIGVAATVAALFVLGTGVLEPYLRIFEKDKEIVEFFSFDR